MITQAYITLKNLLFLYVNLEGDSVLFKGEGMGDVSPGFQWTNTQGQPHFHFFSRTVIQLMALPSEDCVTSLVQADLFKHVFLICKMGLIIDACLKEL